MKKKIYLFIIILILIFIILNFCNSKNNIFNDIMIFSLWNDLGIEESKNEYIINPQNQETLTIDVFRTIQNGINVKKVKNNKYNTEELNISEKIAPGSYGNFTIKLEKTLKTNCIVQLKELNSKPKNLVFIIDEQRYNSTQEMQEKLNQIFKVKNIVVVNWKWEYETTQEKNIQDTKDGENIFNYKFEIKVEI